jgi:hypothetical protein
MALSKRQMACFEGNRVFLDEVAAALLPIAAAMLRAAIVVQNTPDASAVDKAFAAAREGIARQILNEQGITLQAANPYALGNREATGGSVAMKYLVQQMLLMPTWEITPDEWVADEATARATITASMTALLNAMTAIPEAQA